MSSIIVKLFQASKFDIKVFLLHSMHILACALNVSTYVDIRLAMMLYIPVVVLSSFVEATCSGGMF